MANFKDKYDVICIGAGMAGLVAGNFLAKKKKDVLVLEQHSIPGGYVSGFKRKGYYFDSGDMSFGSYGIIFPMLETLGSKCKIPIGEKADPVLPVLK